MKVLTKNEISTVGGGEEYCYLAVTYKGEDSDKGSESNFLTFNEEANIDCNSKRAINAHIEPLIKLMGDVKGSGCEFEESEILIFKKRSKK